MHEGIRRVLYRRLGFFLRPAKYVLTQFAVKQGGHTNTECPLHQDWSMPDESRLWFIETTPFDVDAAFCPLAIWAATASSSLLRPNMPYEFSFLGCSAV